MTYLEAGPYVEAEIAVDALTRLLQLQYRSLPMYLVEADPWTASRGGAAVAALRRIVADQESLARRTAELLEERRIPIDPGEFPMEFTDLNFLSMQYMKSLLIESLQQQAAGLRDCIVQLQDDPRGRALAEEALGANQAHLEMLEELSESE